MLDNSEFYADKCTDAGNNVLSKTLRNNNSKYYMKRPDIDPKTIIITDDDNYIVPSETKEDVSYFVDLKLRYCSCHQGRLRGPCKHKFIVSESFGVACFDVIPSNNPQVREQFMFLGTGKRLDKDWFLPIQDNDSSHHQCTVSNYTVDDAGDNALLQEEDDEVEENECTNSKYTVEDTCNNTNLENEDDKDEENDESADNAMDDVDFGNNTLRTDDESSTDDRHSKSKELDEYVDNVLLKLKDRLKSRLKFDLDGYKKAFKVLDKNVDQLPKSSDSAIQKALFSFGKTDVQV